MSNSMKDMKPLTDAERISALERRVAELDAFNYTVVHELRAPLQAVSGFARSVEAEEAHNLSPKARSRLRRVVAGALKMESLIDDLLMLMRTEHIKPEKHPVPADEIVRDILRELRQAYPSTRVIVSELPLVNGDASMVRQVFVNIIGNALKYSHLAGDPLVEIGIDAEGAFTVRDNGIGFRMEDAGMLFEPFQRLTRDVAYPGTGVGLAIVKRLIERHGGWIAATSREDGPTEFRFSFEAE